jgi:2-polyprenyl-3-methyl-5-hydroxy-6-metoxy-1,4-benzoquinol methylase
MSHDLSDDFFEKYLRHYREGSGRLHAPYGDVVRFRLDRIPRWLKGMGKDLRILDAGCADGYLLSLLWQDGYRMLFGVDLSEQLVARAKNILPTEVEIVHANVVDFFAGAVTDGVDVVLLHHVLEHIPREQTVALLKSIRHSLKPGGFLNIKVPNATAFFAGNYLYGDFTHLVHFNEHSLRQVLEVSGFDVSSCQLIQHAPQLYWSWRYPLRAGLRLINHVRWRLHRVLFQTFCRFTGVLPVPLACEAELDVLVAKC